MKNILVLAHDDDGQEARLQAALDLARAVGGHLTCLDVAAFMPFVDGDSVGISGGATLIELERASEAANRVRIEPRIAAEGVPYEWIDTTGYFESALEQAAILADLVVVNLADPGLVGQDERNLAAALVVDCGKPVMAVPVGSRGFHAGGAALVAWNGSRPAAHALSAAVPLLLLAERVTLLEVGELEGRASAEEAARYLSRHGVHARVERVTSPSPADALLVHLRAGRYGYLVMGAYGRTRLSEALFGGVTRRLLRESPVPLFVAH